MTIETISISAIYNGIETQSRATINEEVVTDYAECMKAGTKFPPIVLFCDEKIKAGSNLFIADGFHRVAACIKNGCKGIEAEVHPGGQLDAIGFAIGANSAHGLRRTNADKRRCVWLALENFGTWSNNAIAVKVNVSDMTVAKIRADFDADKTVDRIINMNLSDTCGNSATAAQSAIRTGRDGKTYPACKNPRSAAVKGESQILTALKTLWSQAAAGEKESFAGWVRQTTGGAVKRAVNRAGKGACKGKNS